MGCAPQGPRAADGHLGPQTLEDALRRHTWSTQGPKDQGCSETQGRAQMAALWFRQWPSVFEGVHGPQTATAPSADGDSGNVPVPGHRATVAAGSTCPELSFLTTGGRRARSRVLCPGLASALPSNHVASASRKGHADVPPPHPRAPMRQNRLASPLTCSFWGSPPNGCHQDPGPTPGAHLGQGGTGAGAEATRGTGL